MVALREPITTTDYQIFLGVICGDMVMRHCAYVKERTTWYIQEEKSRTRQIEGDFNFRDLERKIKKLSRKDR